MVPVLTEGGRSFKGAALYYLHDKRREGEAARLTDERVAWTQTVNLPTDDADRGWRMMATTAMKADELKAAAGVKATGRKLTKPALAYSLSWHPDEKPSQAEQIETARETLKLLGLSEHQALIVAHNDEPHAHVHVIVNRVHPSEGKAATLSKSKLILSEWAQAYEQKRGQVLCPKRAENNAKRRQGEHVRDPRVARPTYEFRRAVANDSMTAAFVRTEQAAKDAQLAQAGRGMHESHGRQWDALKGTYKAAKDRLYEQAEVRKKAQAEAVKQAYRPRWGALFAKQRDDRRLFEGRERSPIGKAWNMVQTARELRRQGITADFLSMAWGVLRGTERRNAFEVAQERERLELATIIKKRVTVERELIRRQTKMQADKLRDGFLAQCAALRESQRQQQGEMKVAWANRNAERKAAYAPLRDQVAKWDRLKELGQQARRGQGIAPGMQRARGLRRE